MVTVDDSSTACSAIDQVIESMNKKADTLLIMTVFVRGSGIFLRYGFQ